MKLAALGVITAVIGIGLDLPGLLGIGVYWALLGPVVRRDGRRLQELRQAVPGTTPPIDGRTFAYGTLLWALLAVPSLLVGLLDLGIDAEHADWRWLPIVVGGLAAGVGGIGSVLYLLGSAVQTVGDQLGVPDVPATLRILSVRETGTFVNERPRLEFVFQVVPDQASALAPYEVTKKATVPFTSMGALRVGDGFRALVVGPDDPTRMEIGWDQPLPATDVTGAADVAARLEALEQLRTAGTVTEAEYAEQRERILGTL
ncbi:MAG: SHOCT domain-containing protein [Propionibacteriales bacterium]|nr:SHOCT domain-containing protein [Propionibacteriales bacterium]